MGRTLLSALMGTGFTFLMTATGAAAVFLFQGDAKGYYQKACLGFAAGVMIAASVWSLLIPAIDLAESLGQSGWGMAAGGFLFGGVFFLILDKIIPHLHMDTDRPEGMKSQWKRTTMLVTAVTLHNLPEGMAVGLSCALAASSDSPVNSAAAFTLALGIGLQNLPEGAAIALPLRQEGMSKTKAFLWGSVSGLVEPIGAVITVLTIKYMQFVMPFLLAFAAGAMIYVVAEELIPEANSGEEHSNVGTVSLFLGFALMMVLDVTLG
ncbi:zinc transporter [Clostridia bacterium]|nr:zinc transporter [Clostridia bacterium]